MIAKLLESGWAEIVYEDNEARLLKIRDAKGDAPTEATDDENKLTPEEKKQLDEEMEKENANTADNQDEENQ
jgi:hypothetical protein